MKFDHNHHMATAGHHIVGFGRIVIIVWIMQSISNAELPKKEKDLPFIWGLVQMQCKFNNKRALPTIPSQRMWVTKY
jgi:hypothetical protein